MLIIGSRAMKEWYPDSREPKDWDIIITRVNLEKWLETRKRKIMIQKWLPKPANYFVKFNDGTNFEFFMARTGSSEMGFLENNRDSRLSRSLPDGAFDFQLASLSTLMAIKRSHLYWPIKWAKHISDYHILREKGIVISLEDARVMSLRIEEAAKIHQTPKINLKMSNKAFFGKSDKLVKRAYEHDDLHAVTCYYDIPLYDSLKDDKSSAFIPKAKFDALDYNDRVRLVREEAYAIALEREIIPAIDKHSPFSPQDSFQRALMRISTTLTKGWFRDFAIENWPVIRMYDRDYVECFLEAVRNGKIQKKDREVQPSPSN